MLEGIFKFWRNDDHMTFPVVELWLVMFGRMLIYLLS